MGWWSVAAYAQDDLYSLPADEPVETELTERDFILDTVVVTGTRREEAVADLPMSVEVIPRSDIDSSGAETVAEMLEEQPGMQVFDAVRGQGLRLRGLEPEHTLVLVDGDRTIGRMDGVLDLSRWQLDDVERIEVVRGAASALWGSDALAGVINLIPRVDRPGWSARIRATYGYQDRRRSNRRSRFEGGPRVDEDGTLPDDDYGATYDLSARFGYAGERAGGSAFVALHHLDAFDLDPRDGATNGPETRTYNGGGSLWFKRGPARFRLRAEVLHRDAEALETRGPRVVLQRLNRTDTATISLAPTIETRHGQLTLRASYSRFRDQFLRRVRDQPQSDPTIDTREQLGQLQIKYLHTVSDAHILTVGYDTSLQGLASPRLDRSGTRARLAPYIQHEWTPSEAPYVSVVPGLRLDADTWYGSQLSPKLALRVDPHKRFVMRSSVGRGFRAPDFRELLLSFTDNASIGYVVYGNEDLQPERAWTLDGGFELRLDRFWLGATGFGSWVQDLITTDLVATQGTVSEYRYINIGRARTRGLEAMARVRAVESGAHRLRIDLGYTFLDADDRSRSRALPGRARHAGTMHVRYRGPHGVSALWRSRLSGARVFYDEDTRVVADPFLSLDLRLEKSFLDDHLVAFVGVDNVLNNGGTYLGARPRTFWFGIAGRRTPEDDDRPERQ